MLNTNTRLKTRSGHINGSELATTYFFKFCKFKMTIKPFSDFLESLDWVSKVLKGSKTRIPIFFFSKMTITQLELTFLTFIFSEKQAILAKKWRVGLKELRSSDRVGPGAEGAAKQRDSHCLTWCRVAVVGT